MDNEADTDQGRQAAGTRSVPVAQQSAPGWARPYQSGCARAAWTVSLWALMILMRATAIVLAVSTVHFLDKIQNDEPYDANMADLVDAAVAVVNVLIPLLWWASLIALLMWIHRAYRNLPALAARYPDHSPRWAVAFFFVPFANLVMPRRVMKEIWIASDPVRVARVVAAPSTRKPASSAIVGCWWVLWLTACFFSILSSWQDPARTYGQAALANWSAIYAHIALIIAALMTILVVRRVDRNQSQSHALLRQHSPPNNDLPATHAPVPEI
jgi:hypothetical protein